MNKKITSIIIASFVALGCLSALFLYYSSGSEEFVDSANLDPLKNPNESSTDNAKSDYPYNLSENLPNRVSLDGFMSEEPIFSNVVLKNNEVNPYPDSLTMTGLTSMYPELPADVYFDNIKEAENGSSTAQYLVARALEQCKGIGSKAEIQEQVRLNILSEMEINRIKAHYDRCEGLVDVFPEKELNSFILHYDWLVKAEQNGNFQAKAAIYQIHPERYSRSEALHLITKSLETRSQSDFLPYDALKDFVSNNTEDGELNAYELEIAICMNLDWCNDKAKIAYAEYYENKNDSDKIKENAKILSQLIKSNDIIGVLQFTNVNAQD